MDQPVNTDASSTNSHPHTPGSALAACPIARSLFSALVSAVARLRSLNIQGGPCSVVQYDHFSYRRLAGLAVLVVTIATAAWADSLSERADALFAKWDNPDSPGAAIAIVRDGKLIHTNAFGSSHLGYQVPNEPHTLFEVGSMSKSFMSALVARLMDEEKIAPNDNIREYLPELQQVDPPIRIRHLLRCRSGVWAQWHIVQLAGWSSEPIESPYLKDDLLALYAKQKTFPFQPGEEFLYGSGDFFLLGLIIERVTGKTPASFARDELFAPLGMTHTHYTENPARPVTHLAAGHHRGPSGDWLLWSMNASVQGGWGLKTSVAELAKWAANFDDNKLPRGRYLDELIHEGTVLDNRKVLDSQPTGEYRGLKRIQFTGGMPGFRAAITRFPERKFSVVCLANNTEIDATQMTRQIADFYLADDFEPVREEDKPTPDAVEFVELTGADLSDKVGAYRMGPRGPIWRIDLEAGTLRWTDHRDKTFDLCPVDATHFRPSGSPIDHNSFLFAREDPVERYTLTLKCPDGSQQLTPVELIEPTADQLAQFAGRYFSEELTTTYRIKIDDGSLWLRVSNRRWERLSPVVRDQFAPTVRRAFDNRLLTFHRNGVGEVVGFDASLFRIGAVPFVRVE